MTDKVLRHWMETKKKWEDIFSLRVPKPENLLDLMEKWSDFRRITITLATEPAQIKGGDKFYLDAQSFLQEACQFFGVQSYKDLPFPGNLPYKLIEASTKAQGKSTLSTEMFKADFPKAVKEAKNLKQQRKEEEKQREEETIRIREEQRKQEIHDKVEQDPFFLALNGIQGKINGEITRISLKNPNDDRITHLRHVEALMQSQISTTKQSCKEDFLSYRGKNQESLRSECKNQMKTIIKIHLMDNNALEMSWREKIGRAILNAIIALPVKIKSISSNTPSSNLFFKFKTTSKENIENIQDDIDKIETKPYKK
ncbi:hypothetical protein [Legionella israelensis]|uniref:Uncharacterized protein n=1 Tax=Legionella israelensis TaxID=454 RepID=A0A0W0VEM1_9GAMM|nr:hypothetical protein [Legionella israelensis]KTD18523.1 hypothetical protein Lisr_2152 [Legionella israelensis]QBS10453.1 hypothetical protein E4T55_11650 [Legionella israelensis]SCY47837.1 hypothetical protein SAMN02746069_02596 [Legionella israelensis DSM 19235]STX60077.1 Uncharacterised protein [Legionella israelensis]